MSFLLKAGIYHCVKLKVIINKYKSGNFMKNPLSKTRTELFLD